MAMTSKATPICDLKDGEQTEMKGSGSKPYIIKNVGGVYSCSCPAWRNQSTGVIRTCKHIRKLRGDAAEEARLGGILAAPVKDTKKVTAPPVLLAQTWTPDIDPKGWLMSEKLDGVRAWWDGKNFISRLGNTYYAPDWFKAQMPKCILDGELWLGRKQFQKCISIVRRQDMSKDWENIQFLVFDAPRAEGPFTQRLEFLRDAILIENGLRAVQRDMSLRDEPSSVKYIAIVDQIECKGVAHLKKKLAQIEKMGGEGVMLRDPRSLYDQGRSPTLLKVKSFLDDEATVIGHEAGKGKHKGRLGALLVKRQDGIEFSVGTGFTDKEREDPPELGATITYRYQELTDGGVPRFPSYIRMRDE